DPVDAGPGMDILDIVDVGAVADLHAPTADGDSDPAARRLSPRTLRIRVARHRVLDAGDRISVLPPRGRLIRLARASVGAHEVLLLCCGVSAALRGVFRQPGLSLPGSVRPRYGDI